MKILDYLSNLLYLLPLANSHLGDSGMMKYNKDKRAAGAERIPINHRQFLMPAQDKIPTSKPPKKGIIYVLGIHGK